MKLNELIKEEELDPRIKDLKVGDTVCFKYDVEQCGKIEKITSNVYGKKFHVRAFHGDYVMDRYKGVLVTLAPDDIWLRK